MVWSFCSAKGGVGTSTIVGALAAAAAQRRRVLIVDLDGDQPDIFGCQVVGPGLLDWLSSSAEPQSIDDVVLPVGPGIELLARGSSAERNPVAPHRIVDLIAHLDTTERLTLVDLGVLGSDRFGPASVMAATSRRRTLVVRACYLCLRRSRDLTLEIDDVIEVREGGRALTTTDIEGVLGRPVDHRIPWDPSIARMVDAGTFGSRQPRRLRQVVKRLERTAGADSIDPLGAR